MSFMLNTRESCINHKGFLLTQSRLSQKETEKFYICDSFTENQLVFSSDPGSSSEDQSVPRGALLRV